MLCTNFLNLKPKSSLKFKDLFVTKSRFKKY